MAFGSAGKMLFKAFLGEGFEQTLKAGTRKGAKFVTGVNPKQLGLISSTPNVTKFYNNLSEADGSLLKQWNSIGDLNTADGKRIGTVNDFNNQVVHAIEDDAVDGYENVLGMIESAEEAVGLYNRNQMQPTVDASLRSPQLAGANPVQQQGFRRQDNARVKELSKGKLPDRVTSASANVTLEPLQDNPNVFMSSNQADRDLIPWEISPENVETLQGMGAKLASPMKKQQHHELMKGLFSQYIIRAKELGTELDVTNLGFLARDDGFDLGDKFKAMFFADKLPHDEMHRYAIAEGIQPSGAGLDTAKYQIQTIDNIDQLTKEFVQDIKEIAIPMREEMKYFQEAWEQIPESERLELIRLRLARKAAGKKGSPAYKEAEKVYKAFKNEILERLNRGAGEIAEDTKAKKEAIDDHFATERYRQLGG